jgi:hypothetical protein
MNTSAWRLLHWETLSTFCIFFFIPLPSKTLYFAIHFSRCALQYRLPIWGGIYAPGFYEYTTVQDFMYFLFPLFLCMLGIWTNFIFTELISPYYLGRHSTYFTIKILNFFYLYTQCLKWTHNTEGVPVLQPSSCMSITTERILIKFYIEFRIIQIDETGPL